MEIEASACQAQAMGGAGAADVTRRSVEIDRPIYSVKSRPSMVSAGDSRWVRRSLESIVERGPTLRFDVGGV
jgi:hypothetical protein